MRRPLEGIQVLDFTRAVAGPFCTMTLGDLGADIIKVEQPDAGDETRHWGPPFVAGQSTYFLGLNRNKRNAWLGLKTDEGRGEAQRMARSADVVIENFRPGVAGRLGIGYESLAAGNRDLIYASISGFGQTGPLHDKPGYDLIVQAMAGLMHVSGAGEPVKCGFPVADVLAALYTGTAIVSALFAREKGQGGRCIEVALLDGLLASMTALTSAYLMAGRDTEPMGTALPNITPYQVFHCQDAPIAAGVPNDRLWRRLCLALGRQEWAERFPDNRARNENREELVAMIGELLRTRPARRWIELLEQHGVPCGPVQSVGQMLADPALEARGLIVNAGGWRMVGNPIRMRDTEWLYTPPPVLTEIAR